MDKISVVVPIYNVLSYVDKTIESIVKQTHGNLEIILVDDGATDGSGEVCDHWGAKDSRIKVFHNENKGLSAARNFGEQNATAEYVIFIDGDDYIHEKMIETLYHQIEEMNADVSCCGVMNVYTTKETPQYHQTDELHVFDKKLFLRELLIGEKIPGTICNKLIRKELTSQLSFPEGKIYEDAFYHLDLIKKADSYVVNTQPHYYYYHRENSITTSSYSDKKLAIIEAYHLYYEYVEQQFPKLETEAFFRLSYAYFVVLDNMLLEENFKEINEYPEVVGFLKLHALKIANNSIFRKGRRIAAVCLKMNVGIYRWLMLQDAQKNKGINTNEKDNK